VATAGASAASASAAGTGIVHAAGARAGTLINAADILGRNRAESRNVCLNICQGAAEGACTADNGIEFVEVQFGIQIGHVTLLFVGEGIIPRPLCEEYAVSQIIDVINITPRKLARRGRKYPPGLFKKSPAQLSLFDFDFSK
jgi:hypothetical protein